MKNNNNNNKPTLPIFEGKLDFTVLRNGILYELGVFKKTLDYNLAILNRLEYEKNDDYDEITILDFKSYLDKLNDLKILLEECLLPGLNKQILYSTLTEEEARKERSKELKKGPFKETAEALEKLNIFKKIDEVIK